MEFIEKRIKEWTSKNIDYLEKLKKELTKPKEFKLLNPQDVYIIDKILAKNAINIFTGYYRSGKTWIVLHILKSILLNQFYNYQVFGEHRILYWNGENSEEGIASRLKILDFPQTDNFRFICKFPLIFEDLEKVSFVSDLIQKEGFDIVVFDPLRAFFEGNENKSEVIRKVFSTLKTQFCDKGITVILTHHLGKFLVKENEADVESRPKSLRARGSSDIGASADIVFNVYRINKKDGFEIVLEQDKNFFDPEIKPLKFDFSNPQEVVCVDYSIETTKTEMFKKLFEETIKEDDDLILSREDILKIAESCGVSLPLLNRILRTYRESQLIRVHKKGRNTFYQWVGDL